jgi:hypothetical protein
MKDGNSMATVLFFPKAIAWGLVPEDSKWIKGSIMPYGYSIFSVEDSNAYLVMVSHLLFRSILLAQSSSFQIDLGGFKH